MRSSISNSETDKRKWLKIWLLAACLVVLVTGAWEWTLRQAGLEPEYSDNRALWLSARHRLTHEDESVVAILGASRVQRAIDVDVLAEQINRPVVQLAIEGSSALPVLENLAADPRFRGTVIFSISPSFSFNRRLSKKDEGLQGDWTNAYLQQSRSRRVEQELRLFVQGMFAFRSTDAALSRIIQEIVDTRELAGPDFKTTQRNRFVGIDLSTITNDKHPEDIVAMYRRNATPYDKKGLSDIVRYFSTLVDILNAKGCRVFVLRLPSEGAVLEYERLVFPRNAYWDQIQGNLDAQFIHFEDYPELEGYLSNDGSHIATEEASEFTERLASILSANGV